MEMESNVVDTELQNHQRPHQQQQHVHVLAVDDSIIDRKLLEKLLKVSSYQVTCVDSGNKALEYLGLLDSIDTDNNNNNNNNFDAASSTSPPTIDSQSSKHEGLKVNMIMTDFCMPGMTGYDLLKRVKGSSWKDVPVVVMSSENVPSRINMCLEGGAEEFLLKPVQLSDLEKLQPCLLKACGHSCNKIDNDFDNSHDNENNNNSNSASKRKAMSPDLTERRPKMKGLAVV